MQNTEGMYMCLACHNSIFNRINNYAKKQWGEEYKEKYDFSQKKDLQEMTSLFFADYEPVNKIEEIYGKHTRGAYDLDSHINLHNIVQLEKEKFLELIQEWKIVLTKLSGKQVQLLDFKPENKHNPSKELNEAKIFF